MAIKNWVKRKLSKAKKLLIASIIGTSVLAAGSQTTLLDTSPINYPLTANTNLEKLEFLYQSQEILRFQFREMGRQYREGIITGQEWEDYKKIFEPKNYLVAGMTATIGGLLADVAIQTATGTTMYNARQFYKATMKRSTTWTVDLNNVLK